MSTPSGRGGRTRGNGNNSVPRGPSSRGRGRGASALSLRGNAAARARGAGASRGNGNATRGARQTQGAGNNNNSSAAGVRGNWADRLKELTRDREQERAAAISSGILSDPNNRRKLSEAITPVGTCLDMCPEYERVERVVQRDIWEQEKDPNRSAYSITDHDPDEARMVKKFKRPDAGADEQLPSDLRPPAVLKRTTDFLFDDVLANASSLDKVHGFVWDRTRGIRNDFSIQQVSKPEDMQIAIDCYERIARFHILSLHLMSTVPPQGSFSPHQEREQLDATLLSLMDFYDENQGKIALSNEAEFRAYFILFHLQDPDVEDRAQTWPTSLLQDAQVQEALRLYAAACNIMDEHGPLRPFTSQKVAQQDWQRLWTLVGSKRVSYLMACAAEIYFSLVRRMALNAIWRSFRNTPTRSPQYFTLEFLSELLCFDSDESVKKFCQSYNFSFSTAEDVEFLDLTSVGGTTLPTPKMKIEQIKSRLVEDKRFGRTLPAIVNGMTVKQAQDAGMVEMEEALDDAVDGNSAGEAAIDESEEDGESLFIPEARKTSSIGDGKPASPFANATGFGAPSEIKPAVASPFANATGFGAPSKIKPAVASPFAGAGFGKPPSGFGAPSTTPGIFLDAAIGADKKLTESTPGKFNFLQSSAPSATPSQSGSSQTASPTPTLAFSSFTATVPTCAPQATITQSSVDHKPEDTAALNKTNTLSPKTPNANTPSFSWDTAQAKLPENVSASPIGPKPTASSLFASPAVPLLARKSPPPDNTALTPTPSFNFGSVGGASGTFAPSNACAPAANTSQTLSAGAAQKQPAPPTPAPAQAAAKNAVEQPNRRASPANFQPKKPSPLSYSFGPEEDAEKPAPARKAVKESQPARRQLFAETKDPATSRTSQAAEEEATLTRLASEFTFQAGVGFFQQYLEYTVGKAITETQERLYNERVNAEADDFRRTVLAHRYLRRWRDQAWRKRLASRGRARRQRAQEALRESRTQPEIGSVLGSVSRLGGSNASSITGPSVSKQEQVDVMFQQVAPIRTVEQQSVSGSRRHTVASRDSVHNRLKNASRIDDNGRVSKPKAATSRHEDLLRRSSFLGFSVDRDAPKRASTTKTNYFRMKALGMEPPPTRSAPRGIKRSREDSMDDAARTRLKPSPEVTVRETVAMQPPAAPCSIANQVDDALIDRLNSARERLRETSLFFRSETAKLKHEDLRRSTGSQDFVESPSMTQARAEARWKTSQNGALSAATCRERDVPAYRLRESRFVPRELYDKAIERSRNFRASRSREVSRSVSRLDNESITFSPLAGADPQSLGRSDAPVESLFIRSQIASPQPTKPNGIPKLSQPKPQPPSFGEPSHGLSAGNSFTSFAKVPPHPLLQSLNHHTSADPFSSFANKPAFGDLSPAEQGSFRTLEPNKPAFDCSTAAEHVDLDSLDFTIKSEQVEESLSNSFGHQQRQPSFEPLSSIYQEGQDQNGQDLHEESANGQSPEHLPPQQASSYLQLQDASQAISLLSDDEDDVQTQQPPSSEQRPIMNGDDYMAGDTEEDSIDGDAKDDFPAYNPVSNTYAAFARVKETGEEDDGEDFGDSERGADANNPYAALARDDGDGYGDSEGDETEEDEGEGEHDGTNGYRSYDSEDEDGDGEDEEDFSEQSDGNLEEPAQHPYYMQPSAPPPPPPPKNDALLAVGNTEEEAIELSD